MTKDTLAQIETAKFIARIEGMKAENLQRTYCQNAPAYSEDSFAVETDKYEVAIRKIQDIPEGR
jgi:hypothetical protein